MFEIHWSGLVVLWLWPGVYETRIMNYLNVLAGLLICGAATGYAAEPGQPQRKVQTQFKAGDVVGQVAPGTNQVKIRIEGDQRIIESNGLPDHKPGQFPNRGNPNSLSAQKYVYRMPIKPKVAENLSPDRGASFGVALNGVPFEPGTAEFWNRERGTSWVYEAMSGIIDLGIDEHNAHVQPTGAYHYHGLPIGLMKKLGASTNKMTMVGYAADGFPIYTDYGYADPKDAKSPVKKLKSSYKIKTGKRPANTPPGTYDGTFTPDYEYVKGAGDLDDCNGRFGVTAEYPQGTYYYCITEEFPQLSRYWKGTPDASFRKGPPGGGRGGPGGQGGPGRGGPPGGSFGGPSDGGFGGREGGRPQAPPEGR